MFFNLRSIEDNYEKRFLRRDAKGAEKIFIHRLAGLKQFRRNNINKGQIR